MKFDISAFTHAGTVRKTNQDSILVNDMISQEGEIHLREQDSCTCFVADGVGGNNAGDFASNFVLEKIRLLSDFNSPVIERSLQEINQSLLEASMGVENLRGAATTLTGLVISEKNFRILHAGDSQLWLLRNEMFFKITKDQVLNQYEENSPITSFFGGYESSLKPELNMPVDESIAGDNFLICSDGIFKSLSQKVVKSILITGENLEKSAQKILETCLQTGAEDNISLIIIRQIR